MKRNITQIIVFFTLFISVSSFTQNKSFYLINDELFKLKGDWEIEGQLESSGQYVLRNKKERLNLLISVRKPEYFKFYEKDLTEKQLLDRFYKWEYDHWADSTGLKSEVSEIKANTYKNYIVWKLTVKDIPDTDNESLTSYILYAVRNNRLISISISSRKEEFTESYAVKYLEKLYKL